MYVYPSLYAGRSVKAGRYIYQFILVIVFSSYSRPCCEVMYIGRSVSKDNILQYGHRGMCCSPHLQYIFKLCFHLLIYYKKHIELSKKSILTNYKSMFIFCLNMQVKVECQLNLLGPKVHLRLPEKLFQLL